MHFYDDICDALSSLVLSGAGNVKEAKRELRHFCSRVHHFDYHYLCGSCEITQNLIKEMADAYLDFINIFILLNTFADLG